MATIDGDDDMAPLTITASRKNMPPSQQVPSPRPMTPATADDEDMAPLTVTQSRKPLANGDQTVLSPPRRKDAPPVPPVPSANAPTASKNVAFESTPQSASAAKEEPQASGEKQTQDPVQKHRHVGGCGGYSRVAGDMSEMPKPANVFPAHLDAPLDPAEQPILDELLELRSKLLELKKDRSGHVKCEVVMPLYESLIIEVDKLNTIRQTKEHEQNRLDRVLDDCFQLISLFFMTLGKNFEAPAIYAVTANVIRLTSHLEESRLYSHQDLVAAAHFQRRMREIWENGKADHSPALMTLLEKRLNICEQTMDRLFDYLSTVDERLRPIHLRLISILRSMTNAATRQHFPAGEVKSYARQLQKLADSRVDGKFVADDGTVPENQEVIISLLDRVMRWTDAVLKREAKVCPGVKPIYDELYEIRLKLEQISLTQAWSLRETDLFDYQRKLTRIDEARVDGNFVDADGRPTDIFSLRLCLYLLRKCYAYIFLLLTASEPVSEALLPIFNQMSTLRRCLVQVQAAGGVSSIRELYPYQMKLDSIEKMRVNGAFPVAGYIPEGQGAVNLLARENQEIIHQLKATFTAQEPSATDTAAIPTVQATA